MIMPKPNTYLSGTPTEMLLEQCSATIIALMHAREVLAAMAPNHRDYSGMAMWEAQKEHKRRDTVLRDLIVSIRDQQDAIVENE